MINHLRTLLLNVDGAQASGPTFPGEEFVPPDFKAVSPLPGYLQAFRRLLFGAAPDRAMLNYRLRQLLPLLHVTALAEFVFSFDPRVTYWPFLDTGLVRDSLQTVISQISGAPAALFVEGEMPAPDDSGIMRRIWQITIVDLANVQIDQLTPPGPSSIAAYTLTSGLSNPIALPGSNLNVQFPNAFPARWQVTAYGRPQRGASDLLTGSLSLGSENINELFAAGTPTGASEPFMTFRNLWEQHFEPPYALGGLLLAAAYRTDQIRQGIVA